MEDILATEGAHPASKVHSTHPSHALLRERLSSIDVNQVDLNGNTLLHKLVERTAAPTPVYIFAECGVPINKVNKVGESALHVAVKADKLLLVEALLQCGADPNLADKYGVTPAALCSSKESRTVMSWFQPGLYQAVTSGDFGSVCKLIKYWISVRSKTLDGGRSIFDLSKSRDTEDVYVLKCMQKIRDSETQSTLIHAVLADNAKRAREILDSTKMRTVNCRYKGERSLLSIALENRNAQLVQQLLENGVKTNGRVRHRLLPVSDTVPCVLLAYSCQPDVQIAQLLWNYGIHALQERDTEGNTALIRAVKHRASLPLIQWYITATQGQTIAKRNIERMTAYEVAEGCGSTDICSYINQYIDGNLERLKVPLTVQFYGSLHSQLRGPHEGMEAKGIELFVAACCNDVKALISNNHFNYQDRNGFTVLHKAVSAGNVDAIKEIAHTRPVLKGMADNHGRYPLHLAFLLPDNEVLQEILSILLQSNAENYEYACDANGKNPADYKYFDEEVKQSILRSVQVAAF